MAANEQAATTSDGDISDEQVREFLKDHSDFLERNPDMLDYLHISHASGSAVSLVEKQVSVLRERNIEMRRRLNALTANARDNDALYEKTRGLILKLLETSSQQALAEAFNDAMAGDFQAEHAAMVLFGDPATATENCRVDSAERAKIEIGALLKGGKAVCGPLRKEELQYLFPDCSGIGSAALSPLFNGEELGFIAVGSSDANRYGSSTGTLFLSHIAEVIVRLLPRLNH